jgi:hypothetical protein
MNWYYCREVWLQINALIRVYFCSCDSSQVLRRFRSKIQVRLTAVTFFIFLLPACSLAALGVRRHVLMFCWVSRDTHPNQFNRSVFLTRPPSQRPVSHPNFSGRRCFTPLCFCRRYVECSVLYVLFR